MRELPQGKRYDLEHQYGCPAHMTVAYFEHKGVAHVARRLWRSDYLRTGRVEVYTIEPWDGRGNETHWYGSTTREDFLRHADEERPTSTDVRAMLALNAVDETYTNLHVDQAKRANLLEV